ncbi:hypothetical protein NXH13_25775, partial [Klebsiella pneumoniae]|nr:hypothetical protein [Klebsiella pneumoniae]
MGSLFKQIYRYTRPRAYRHNENLWPFTRITRAPSGEISALRYKGKTVPLVSLSALKNSMQGEVLLTATGPSTRNIDFWHCCKVSDEAAFCLIQRPYISKTLLT